MKGIIDRFEGDYAIIELDDRSMINVELSLLPSEAKEGDILAEENGLYMIEKDETEKRKKNIEKLIDDLFT